MTALSNYMEDKLADLAFNGTAYAGAGTWYVKLHIGDPGENCTGNPAAHTTRAAVTFGASSGGTVTSDSAASFTSMAATETISHISLWDAASSGNPGAYGALTAPVVVAIGGSFSIPSGQLTVSIQ